MSLNTYSPLENPNCVPDKSSNKEKSRQQWVWDFFVVVVVGLFGGVFLTEFALPETLEKYNPLNLQNHQL